MGALNTKGRANGYEVRRGTLRANRLCDLLENGAKENAPLHGRLFRMFALGRRTAALKTVDSLTSSLTS